MTTPPPGQPAIDVALIYVPYDLDQPNTGMALAPAAFQQVGLVRRLAERYIHVGAETTIQADRSLPDFLTRIASIQSTVADAVTAALQQQLIPILIGGDCLNALGMWRGIQRGLPTLTTGVAWFDAHGDWNTEQTTLSGYLGGMPFAALCGYGNEQLRTALGIEQPATPRTCALIGVRDLDLPEKVLLDTTPVAQLTARQAADDYSPAIDALTVIDAFYLHFDVDVLDTGIAPGVDYPVPGGLSLDRAVNIARGLISNKPIVAFSLTAVNPQRDPSGRTVETALAVLLNILSD